MSVQGNTTRRAGKRSSNLPMKDEHTATVRAASVNARDTRVLDQPNDSASGFQKHAEGVNDNGREADEDAAASGDKNGAAVTFLEAGALVESCESSHRLQIAWRLRRALHHSWRGHRWRRSSDCRS